MEPPLAPPPSEPRWRWRDILAAVVLTVAGFFVAGTLLFVLAGAGGDPSRDGLIEVILTLAFEAWLGGVVALLVVRRGIPARRMGLEASPRWTLVAIAVSAAYLTIMGYSLIIFAAEVLTGQDLTDLVQGNPLPDTSGYSPLVWSLVGISVVAVAPLAEELLFRGFFFRALETVRGPRTAYLLSGLAFGLVHVNLSVLVPFAVIGMIFAWAYRRSGSLWTPVAAHAIFNGISFVLTLAGVSA